MTYVHKEYPKCLYSAECPEGRVFESEDTAPTEPDGWFDSPAKLVPADAEGADVTPKGGKAKLAPKSGKA